MTEYKLNYNEGKIHGETESPEGMSSIIPTGMDLVIAISGTEYQPTLTLYIDLETQNHQHLEFDIFLRDSLNERNFDHQIILRLPLAEKDNQILSLHCILLGHSHQTHPPPRISRKLHINNIENGDLLNL